MDLQGQETSAGRRSTKVTTDPRAGERINEPSGPVANDSLAAESARVGGAYSENRGGEPLGVAGEQSTLANTSTSGATTLPSAPVGTSREDMERQQKYPEALGGQGEYPGAHVPETGYVGGSTSAKQDMGLHRQEYAASQKLEEAPGGHRSEYNAGQAPGYVREMTQNLGDKKPKGNVTEGGFDPDAPNASFSTNIGSGKDPGRAAEKTFQRSTAESGPYASEARWDKGLDKEHWYQPLPRNEPA